MAEKEKKIDKKVEKEAKVEKTLDFRIERIYQMAKEHFGEIRFVGIKRHTKIGWVAKAQFDEFESLVAEGEDAEEALKNLRKRLKKIIERYNMA
jgi:DNA-directed RNA polymerase subunit N (RpoN/RPB10)